MAGRRGDFATGTTLFLGGPLKYLEVHFLSEHMPRKRTPERIRRLKELGVRDLGILYLRVGGFSKEPKRAYWDEPDTADEKQGS